jgi:hypothetical protein
LKATIEGVKSIGLIAGIPENWKHAARRIIETVGIPIWFVVFPL